MTAVDAYPLTWPAHIPRYKGYRDYSHFKQNATKAQAALNHELSLLGASQVVVSCNVGPRKADGSLYDRANMSPPDSGVAVYFVRKKQQQVIACDKYALVWENIYAIAKTIEALRGIERWGSAQMMDQAFTGFSALPQSTAVACWWDVLGVSRTASAGEVEGRYRELARKHHPDVGGDHDKMAEINHAYDSFQAERTANR